MTEAISIGSVEQIPVGEGRNFVVANEEIAVFRTHGGEVFATQASCPHKHGPLADGLLGGSTIVCPLHDRTYDLRTGDEIGLECAKLRTYQVKLTEQHEMLVTV